MVDESRYQVGRIRVKGWPRPLSGSRESKKPEPPLHVGRGADWTDPVRDALGEVCGARGLAGLDQTWAGSWGNDFATAPLA